MRFEITSPCEERWEAMEPREAGRYCGRCEKVVLDLTAMTRAEAERTLLALRAPEACVKLAVDRLGDAVFQRPPPSRAPHWARGLVLATALTGASACATGEPPCNAQLTQLTADPGPAMIPVDTSAALASVEPAPFTGPVPAEALAQDDGDTTPTAEQRALTAAKRRPIPPVRPRLGGISIQPPGCDL